MGSWLTPSDLSDEWADVGRIDFPMLKRFLDVARDQVIAYAPRRFRQQVEEHGILDVDVPESYALAQFRQAQNLYRASVADTDGQIGDEGFAITVYPLDWHVKNLIRPRRGAPSVR